jgi:hypothetical protein
MIAQPSIYEMARYCVIEWPVMADTCGNDLADEAVRIARTLEGDVETNALAYIDMREANDTEEP